MDEKKRMLNNAGIINEAYGDPDVLLDFKNHISLFINKHKSDINKSDNAKKIIKQVLDIVDSSVRFK